MDSPLIYAWPCGHEVQPDECRCTECYRANLYGESAPQGEAVRLFEPAPTQLPGQTSLSTN